VGERTSSSADVPPSQPPAETPAEDEVLSPT